MSLAASQQAAGSLVPVNFPSVPLGTWECPGIGISNIADTIRRAKAAQMLPLLSLKDTVLQGKA
jgi:hypothetical protein